MYHIYYPDLFSPLGHFQVDLRTSYYSFSKFYLSLWSQSGPG